MPTYITVTVRGSNSGARGGATRRIYAQAMSGGKGLKEAQLRMGGIPIHGQGKGGYGRTGCEAEEGRLSAEQIRGGQGHGAQRGGIAGPLVSKKEHQLHPNQVPNQCRANKTGPVPR